MATFRADIEAANDNRRNRRLKWLVGILAALTLIAAIVYWQRFNIDPAIGQEHGFNAGPKL